MENHSRQSHRSSLPYRLTKIIILLIQIVHTNGFCPPGWTEYELFGTCIRLHYDPETWAGAVDSCRAGDGELLTTLSRDMWRILTDKILRDRALPYWIGLNDQNNTGEFHWLDDKKQTGYSAWARGHPDNPGDKSCVQMGSTRFPGNQWSAQTCTYPAKYICEKPADFHSFNDTNDDQGTVNGSWCQRPWEIIPHLSTCVRMFDSARSWSHARVACQTHGGDLVKIETEETYEFISGLINSIRKLGYWVTADGRGEDAPYYTNGDQYVCPEIGHIQGYHYNFLDCESSGRYICEQPSGMCPSKWIFSKDSHSCIRPYAEKMSREDASVSCNAVDAELFAVDKHNIPTELDDLGTDNKTAFWIKSTWKLYTDDKVDKAMYKPWRTINLNVSDVDYLCGKIQPGITGEVMVADCQEQNSFLCQKPPEKCPDRWLKSKETDTCVKFFNVTKTWTEARAQCGLYGGDLVKIINDRMNDFIYDYAALNNAEPVWLGLNDRHNESKYRWLDENLKMNFSRLDVTYPLNAEPSNNCGEINKEGVPRKSWSLADCTLKQSYICERRPAGPGRPVLNVSYHLAPSFAYLEQVLTAHCVASIGGNGVLSWVLHFWNGTARKWTVRDRAKEYLDGPLLLEYDVLLHDYAQPNKKEIIINSTFSFRVEPRHHGAILSCHSIDIDDAHDLHPERDMFSDTSESLFVTEACNDGMKARVSGNDPTANKIKRFLEGFVGSVITVVTMAVSWKVGTNVYRKCRKGSPSTTTDSAMKLQTEKSEEPALNKRSEVSSSAINIFSESSLRLRRDVSEKLWTQNTVSTTIL